MLHGVVVVLPPGSLDLDRLPPPIADLVDPRPQGDAGARWWDVLGIADGTLSQRRHPRGADLLTVTYSSNEAYGPDGTAARFTTELLARCARELGASYGFVSRYPDRWDEPLLTSGTLAPLAAGDRATLCAAPHEAWLFTTARPDTLPGPVVMSGVWGVVVRAAG